MLSALRLSVPWLLVAKLARQPRLRNGSSELGIRGATAETRRGWRCGRCSLSQSTTTRAPAPILVETIYRLGEISFHGRIRPLENRLESIDDVSRIRTVAMLGNHAPRQCGIATFTTHLADAISSTSPDVDCFVLAMNDLVSRHDYPSRVRFEISETDLASYRRAADFLNVNPVDVVSVQHEFGIFGGKAGSYLLALLRELRMPIVTTLHTILEAPDPQQRAVLDEVLHLSERVVVMSERGRAILRGVHGTPNQKIDLIPHGIPDIPLVSASKDRLGIERKAVIFTFGLLSPDKGIDYVIDALPAILARHPETIYLIVGATHPHVKAAHGEAYRIGLEARARKLGVEGSVIFHDRFVSEAELGEFLAAADIYVTPYLKETQITSGTLAYAVGSGRAVVSTPYWYATELLANDRGILVPFRDTCQCDRRRPSLDSWATTGSVCGLLRTRGRARGRHEVARRGEELPPKLRARPFATRGRRSHRVPGAYARAPPGGAPRAQSHPPARDDR